MPVDPGRTAGRTAGRALVALLALAGCDRTSGPDDQALEPWVGVAPAIVTDSMVYHLQRTPDGFEGTVRVTLTNRAGHELHFARCRPESTVPTFSIGRVGPDSTAPYFHPFIYDCVGGAATGRVAPGASLTVIVPLGSPDQPQMQPPLTPAMLVGTLRVTVGLCRTAEADSDYCNRLPLAASQSHVFEVRY
jgi:hypothetical protein